VQITNVCFKYRDRFYLRIFPTKRLFNSTTVWEIVNRGDIFALDLETLQFTVIPGIANVEFFTLEMQVYKPDDTK